jgi:predicted PurR-regulated permease PerM
VNRQAPSIARVAYGSALLVAGLYVIYALRGVLTPVLIAFALAYLLDPVVDRFEALRVPRSLGIAVLLLVSLLVVVISALLLVPVITSDLAALAHDLPMALARLLGRIELWLGDRGIEIPHSGQQALTALQQHMQELAPNAMGWLRSGLRVLLGGTASAASALAAVLVVPVLAFYLLRDFDLIKAAFVELLPAQVRERAVWLGHEVDVVLGHFVRGQLIVMAILGTLYGVGFSLIGVRLAIPIGLIAGTLSFIPYVGSATALGMALLMTALHLGSAAQFAGVVTVYAGIQAAEGLVITPRVVGDKLGLSPVFVLLALMIGGELFGFMGVMLALPMAAVTKVFVSKALAQYQRSTLYGGDGAGEGAPEARPSRLRLRRGRRKHRRVRVMP